MTEEESAQLLRSLGFWSLFWRFRVGSILLSRDIPYTVIAGGLIYWLTRFVAHDSFFSHNINGMVVTALGSMTAAMVTSLSILVGFISKDIGRASPEQFLNVLVDFVWTVGVLLFAIALTIGTTVVASYPERAMTVPREMLWLLAVIFDIYSGFATFSTLQRFLQLAGIALLYEAGNDAQSAAAGPSLRERGASCVEGTPKPVNSDAPVPPLK